MDGRPQGYLSIVRAEVAVLLLTLGWSGIGDRMSGGVGFAGGGWCWARPCAGSVPCLNLLNGE